MRKQSLGLFFILFILLFVVSPIAIALAPPTTFYGNASVNGITVVTGTNISAWVGSTYKADVSANSSATLVYTLEIQGTDCSEGENIIFKINNLTTSETGICRLGVITELNLTATDSTPPGISITYPSAGQILNTKEIEINGTSSDSGYGLSHTNISIYNSAGSLIDSDFENQTFDYVMSWGNFSLSVSVDGNYTINATAYDLAGNSNSATVNIIVDTTEPTLTITTSNNTASNTPLTTIEGTASDTNTHTIYSNNTDWTWNGTYTNWKFTNTTNVAEGLYHILITANDTAGNTKSSLFVFTYDITPPTPSNINKNDSEIKVNDVVGFSTLWTDSGSGTSHSIFSWNNSGSWVNGSASSLGGASSWSNISEPVTKTQGTVIGWMFYANDTAGNWNNTGIQTFTVNNTVPTQPSLTNPTDNAYVNSINMTWSVSTDADSDTLNYYVIVNGTQAYYTTNLYCTYSPANSYYQWNVTPYDGTANGTTSTSRYYTYDSTNPQLTITTSNNTISNTLTTIVGTASDTNANTIYSNNTAWTWNTTYTNWKFTNNTNIADGTYHILITANDSAGNTKSSLFNFTYDSTAPTVTVLSSEGTSTTASTTTISGNATDSGSGIVNVTVNGNNATLNASTGAYFLSVSLSVDSNPITVIAYDQAGNNVTNTSVTVTRTSTSTGGGGGGGAAAVTTTIISFTTAGVNVSLNVNNIAKFAFSGAYHTIKVIKVGTNYVTLQIASDPVTITLNLLESKKLDLNNDNYYDLYIKLDEIKSSKAYLTVKYIHEIITPVVTPPAEEEEEKKPEEVPEELPEEVPEEVPQEEVSPEEEEIPPAKSKTAMIIILIIALLALIGYLIYNKKKRY